MTTIEIQKFANYTNSFLLSLTFEICMALPLNHDEPNGLGAGRLQFEIKYPGRNSGPSPGDLDGARKL